jgi:hypothetical protein
LRLAALATGEGENYSSTGQECKNKAYDTRLQTRSVRPSQSGVIATMKSKTMNFFAQGLLFVASVVALAPQAGMAMGDKVGEFTLPVEVHWGEVVLPAGAYSISTNTHSSTPMMCVYKQGSPMVGYFIPAVAQEAIPTSSQKTELVLGEKDGMVYVKALQMKGDGMEFHYAAPKLKKSSRL